MFKVNNKDTITTPDIGVVLVSLLLTLNIFQLLISSTRLGRLASEYSKMFWDLLKRLKHFSLRILKFKNICLVVGAFTLVLFICWLNFSFKILFQVILLQITRYKVPFFQEKKPDLKNFSFSPCTCTSLKTKISDKFKYMICIRTTCKGFLRPFLRIVFKDFSFLFLFIYY